MNNAPLLQIDAENAFPFMVCRQYEPVERAAFLACQIGRNIHTCGDHYFHLIGFGASWREAIAMVEEKLRVKPRPARTR